MWFSDYQDGQPMPFRARLIVWMHFGFCPRCRRVRASMQATADALSMLGEAPPADPPEKPKD